MGRTTKVALLLPAVALLIACSSNGTGTATPLVEPVTEVTSDEPIRNQCDADAAQELVGSRYRGATTLQRALELAGADDVRLLYHDTVITKEYRTGRLNVLVDGEGRVERVYCG